MTVKKESVTTSGFGSVVKNAGITGVSYFVGLLANYVMIIVLTLSLKANGFGLFSLVIVIKNIATLVGSLGLDITVLRFTSKYIGENSEHRVKTLIGCISFLVLGWSIFVSIAICFLSPFLADYLFQRTVLNSLLRVIIWMIPLEAIFRIFIAGLHGLGYTDIRAYLEQIVLPLSRLLFVVIGLFLVKDVESVLWAMVVASGVSVFIAGTWLSSKCRFWETLWKIPTDWLAWVKYTIPTFLDALLATSLGGSLEVVLLGIFGTNEIIGVYSVLLKLKAILNIPMMAFNNALAPIIGKFHAQGDRIGLKYLFGSATRWVIMLGLPLSSVYILFGHFLLGLFGEQFSIGYFSLIVITLGQCINIVAGPVGHILLMTGYSRIRLVNSVILFVIQLVLGLWLIPNLQLIGASIVAAVSITAISIIGGFEVFVILKIHPYRKDLIKPCIANIFPLLLFGIIQLLTFPTSTWPTFLLMLLFFGSYLAALRSFGLNQSDKDLIYRVTHKRKIQMSH